MTRFADAYPDLVAGLRNRYGEAHRHYHDWSHIEALLKLYDGIEWDDPEAAEIALYYHDAIWQPGATANEAESAALMRRELAGRVAEPTIARAARMVEATAAHAIPGEADADEAGDIARFLDMDLAILGAPADDFDAYDRAIRREFAAVPDAVYIPRRARVMKGFLQRDPLFLTPTFRSSYDSAARENLSRLIARLEGETSLFKRGDA